MGAGSRDRLRPKRIAQGAVVDIEGGGRALVTALCRDHVELAPLSTVEPARNAVVRAIGPLATLLRRVA